MVTSAIDGGIGRGTRSGQRHDQLEAARFFLFSILGMSFWFFLAVPFASHRETYWWLAMVHTEPVLSSLGVISVTYRPVAQLVTWLAFRLLDLHTFPTNSTVQSLLQLVVYGGFAFAWWFFFKAAQCRRLFAIIACLVTGMLFPGYVHLFHVYGLMYVPVMLMLGALIFYYASGEFRRREKLFAALAIVLVLWHPFVPALFAGFYFGFLIETARQRTRKESIRGLLLLILCLATAVGMGLLFARPDAHMSIQVRLTGFFTSYRTTEINHIASTLSFVLSLLAFGSTAIPARIKLVGLAIIASVGCFLFVKSFPLVLLWLCIVLIKLAISGRWGVFFLTAAAASLPFGAGIGSPVFALFAITVAVYVTALDWPNAEARLGAIPAVAFDVCLFLAAAVVILIRSGVGVPVIDRAAQPLLAERERSYQLEQMIVWLHNSKYCNYRISFNEDAGNPIDSRNYGLLRDNRPPSSIDDVGLFWSRVMRCDAIPGRDRTAIMTFGGIATKGRETVFEVPGKYAGNATTAILDVQGDDTGAQLTDKK